MVSGDGMRREKTGKPHSDASQLILLIRGSRSMPLCHLPRPTQRPASTRQVHLVVQYSCPLACHLIWMELLAENMCMSILQIGYSTWNVERCSRYKCMVTVIDILALPL